MNAIGGSISASSPLFSVGAVRFPSWSFFSSSSSFSYSKTLISAYWNKTAKTMTEFSSSSSATLSTAAATTTSPSEVSMDITKPKPHPWLIVGLGNPGKKYDGTRHNVGFEMVDAIAEAEGISMSSVSFKALFGKGFVGNVPVMLAKPQTFMNKSGWCNCFIPQDST